MPAAPVLEAFSISHAQILDGTLSFVDALAELDVANSLDIYGVNEGNLNADVGNYDNNGDDDTLSRWYWLNFAEVSVQAGFLSFPLLSKLTGSTLTQAAIAGASEVQSLSSSGASAGTFTLTFKGQTTAPIAFGAINSAVQSAIQALSTVGSGNVTVSGGPANTTALVFTFAGTLANLPQPMIQIDKTGLTGATGGVFTQTTAGTAVDTQASIDLWHEDSMNQPTRPLMLVCPAKDYLKVTRRLVIGLYSVQFGPIGFDGPSYKDGLKVNYTGTALKSPVNELGAIHSDVKKRVGRLISVLP
jgi:hypothetical protein